MMIERTIGGFVHRYDPVLVARLIELRRPELGECREAPRKTKQGRR